MLERADKNLGGRPKSPSPRYERLDIRLTPLEKRALDDAASAADQANTAAWAREVLLKAADERQAGLDRHMKVLSDEVRTLISTLRDATKLPDRVATLERTLGDDAKELRKDIRNAARIFESFREAVEMMSSTTVTKDQR